MHLTKARLGPLKNFFYYLQEGLPLKLRQIQVLNAVYFMDKVMAILKPFMKKELINMVRLTIFATTRNRSVYVLRSNSIRPIWI